MKKSFENLVPHHSEGVQTNTESSEEFSNEQEAKDFYKIAKKRLLNVNQWNQIASSASAEFHLTDANGNNVDRCPQKNDHIKINIPGPGTSTSEGNDWVQIEKVEEDSDLIALRVRPAANPKNERKEVAHFFDNDATSSFMIKREKNKVIAGVYGRNEKPNTNAESVVGKIRDIVTAIAAFTGLSKLQWKSLVNGFVKKEV